MCLGFGFTFGAVTTISGTGVEGFEWVEGLGLEGVEGPGAGAVDAGAEFCCAAAGTAIIANAIASAGPAVSRRSLWGRNCRSLNRIIYFRTMKK
jgi:hypothetical protein